MATAYGDSERTIQAMKAGAFEYVTKPFDLPALLEAVDRAVKTRELGRAVVEPTPSSTTSAPLVGASAPMLAVWKVIGRAAASDAPVLVVGETGTGKELVARAIHENSARSKEPFITINCGAFPETLLESELFGYVKGAFTGANENRQGLFRGAHGGTLFLDEIGNMGLPMQVKLFRVLQEGKVRPVGSNEEYEIDVRVIAATNKDLDKAIAAGEFREDLYYRLSVIPIQLPPLRERREDIPLLARSFLERFRKTMEKPIEGIAPQAMGLMEAYDWPGNVRELENTMERSVALETGNMISVNVLPEKIQHRVSHDRSMPAPPSNGQVHIPESGIDLEKSVRDMERAYIMAALDASNGVGTRAAELLKMTYRSFRHYSKKYNTR
jgi:DNA-binding NtrC family response regulator